MNQPSCPHCGQAYDASHRMNGDRVFHPSCGGWFLVTHQAGGATVLTKCEPPTSWPKERRKELS